MQETRTYCDVHECRQTVPKDKPKVTIDVVFTTEQTEGRSTKPYLSKQTIDMCDRCMDTIVSEGVYLHAHGAQGHNEYYFKERR